jgi:short-subunit dehydrogenase
MNNVNYVLITGASSGLGKAFAVHLAREGRNLLLMALPGSQTQALATDLAREYGINAEVFELDLTDHGQLRSTISYIQQRYPVDFLINNAGAGGSSAFTEAAPEKIDSIIQLNISSTVLITRLMIPHLQQHAQSSILNVSSMAAFLPIAWKTVYPASKAFISSFSLGLREELRGSNISVSVLYPGPIMTNANTTMRIIHQGVKARIGLLSVADIASIAISGARKGRPLIIPGRMNRINHTIMKLLPLHFKMKLVSREVRKELNYLLT